MRKRDCIGVIAIALLLGLVCAAPAVCAEPDPGAQVLATVGSQTITAADLEEKMSMLPPQFRSRYESPEGRQKLLDQSIKFSLLAQEARAEGIDKRPDVARKIEEVTSNIIIQELTKERITEAVTVSDEDIAKYYEEHKETYLQPEKVKASLIQVEVPADAADDVKKQKREQAEAALKRVRAGEDFDTVAKELSEDKRTRRRGGNTGFFSRGRRANIYGDAFEEQAFALKTGEVSDVFEAKDGYCIVSITDRKEGHQQTVDEVRARIERTVKQEKQKDAYEQYLEALRKKYPVSVTE